MMRNVKLLLVILAGGESCLCQGNDFFLSFFLFFSFFFFSFSCLSIYEELHKGGKEFTVYKVFSAYKVYREKLVSANANCPYF